MRRPVRWERGTRVVHGVDAGPGVVTPRLGLETAIVGMRLGRVALLSRVEAVGWVDSRIADAKVAGMTAGCGYGVRICWVGQEAGVMTIRPKAWITKVSSSGSSPSGWLAWGIVGSGIGDAGHDAMGRWKTRTWSCAVQTGNGVSKLARGGEQFKLVPRHITFVAGSNGFGSTGSSSMLKMLSRLVSAEMNDLVGLDVHGTQRQGDRAVDADIGRSSRSRR